MKPTHIRCVATKGTDHYLTAGKIYNITKHSDRWGVEVRDDSGILIYIFMANSAHGKFNYIHPSVKNPK